MNIAALLPMLTGAGPIALPPIACAPCLVDRAATFRDLDDRDDLTQPEKQAELPRVRDVVTLAAGWPVCLEHAELLWNRCHQCGGTRGAGGTRCAGHANPRRSVDEMRAELRGYA